MHKEAVMHRLLIAAAAMAIALGCSRAAHAQSLGGMALGQALGLQECPTRQGDYLPNDRSACFKWPAGATGSSSAPVEGRVIVNVPIRDRPDFMSGADAVVGLADGRVVSVSVRTHGAGSDTRDLAALRRAFGRTDPRYVTSDNPYQTTQAILADWSLPGGDTVYFNSTEFGRYYGLVRLQAPRATPHRPGAWD